jgi:hypothetical protein
MIISQELASIKPEINFIKVVFHHQLSHTKAVIFHHFNFREKLSRTFKSQ